MTSQLRNLGLLLPDNQIYLEKFLTLCKENDIRLIFATAPIKKITENLFASYTPFDTKTFAKANDIDLITFDPSELNHLHFNDPTHVDNFGSVITSVDISLELSKVLGLPVYQEKLDYYKSFIFKDYSITNIGNGYTISLEPENKSIPLEYKWTVMGNKEIISSSEWQNSSTFRFDLLKTGDFTVEVNIKNPSGDFVLDAIFSITKKD